MIFQSWGKDFFRTYYGYTFRCIHSRTLNGDCLSARYIVRYQGFTCPNMPCYRALTAPLSRGLFLRYPHYLFREVLLVTILVIRCWPWAINSQIVYHHSETYNQNIVLIISFSFCFQILLFVPFFILRLSLPVQRSIQRVSSCYFMAVYTGKKFFFYIFEKKEEICWIFFRKKKIIPLENKMKLKFH